MSQFNSYVQRVNDVAKASFEQIQTAEQAYKDAESKYNANKRPAYGAWRADAATMAKAARCEADYHEKKDAYDKLRRNLQDQTRVEVGKIRRELEKAVNDFFSADPKAIDNNTMELLRSGILKPAEYDRLLTAADQADNATMVRIIGKYADDAAANAKDDNDARALRAVGYKGRSVSGKPYMDSFDVMADTFDRCLRNTSMIGLWDKMTGELREKF